MPEKAPPLALPTAAKGGSAIGPSLIWGIDFAGDAATEVPSCDSAPKGDFRWLHVNLVDHGTRQWIEAASFLPLDVRDLLLSPDTHQRALVDGDVVGCVFHDFERDFDVTDTERVGAMRFALTPSLLLTARAHPLRSADLVRNRLSRGNGVGNPGQALELLAGAIMENVAGIGRNLIHEIQHAEDRFLEGHGPPASRELIAIRRRLAQLDRLLGGMRDVFHRLEEDEALPEALLPSVEKLAQRLRSLDGDIRAGQSQLRLLREEIDLQQTQRTNQNLYLLSIITALMLPATLVTGIFGMNTGGMPFLDSPHGTFIATLTAAAAAGISYYVLRLMGFMRR